jgi:hypothetical protein
MYAEFPEPGQGVTVVEPTVPGPFSPGLFAAALLTSSRLIPAASGCIVALATDMFPGRCHLCW